MSNNEMNFKEYVDKFVSENTAYKSADELLEAKIKKPIFSRGKINKLRFANIEKVGFAIDIADYISFLDYYLGIYPQMFGKWSPVNLASPGMIRSTLTGNNNQTWTEVPLGDPSLENRYDEIHIGTKANGKDSVIAKVCITHEHFDPKNENRNMIFEVCPRVFGAPCPQKYELCVKVIPILHAATKFYLEMNLPGKKGNITNASAQ